MAEATNDEVEILICCICDNECIGPRKLPGCGHTFCETCVLIRVTELKDKDVLVNGFPCPSCEVVSPAPDDVKAAIHWIKSLEKGIDTELEKRTIDKKTKFVQCSPCKTLEKSTKAVKRCDDCNEPFCASCSVISHTHPSLKHHTLVNIEDSNEQYGEAGEIFNTLCKLMECNEHPGNLITFYCNDGEAYACEACVTTKHKDCKDVVKANAAAAEKERVEEEEVVYLKNSAENLNSYAKSLSEGKSDDLAANNKQVESIATHIKAIRENIDQLLDIFEQSAIESAHSAAKKRKTTVDEEQRILAKMETTSDLYIKLLERLQLRGPSYQIDVITRMIKERLKTFETDLLKMSGQFKKNVIRLKQHDDVRKLPTEINHLIHMKDAVEEIKVESEIPRFQSRLLLSHCEVEKVKQISTQGNFPSYPAYNVIYLRTGAIIQFLVYQIDKACIMIDKMGNVSDTLQVTAVLRSWIRTGQDDVATMFREAWKKDKLIALPLSEEKKIVLVSVEDKLQVKYVVDTAYQPKALHVMKNGDIAVAWYDPVAFGVLSPDSVLPQTKVYFRKDKAGREIKSFDFIAVDEQRSHVFQPCTKDNALYCFDFDGVHKFKCDGIISPRGVDHDADGNIYVSAYQKDSLHVISPVGLELRKISIVADPRAISFNKDRDQMVVTQERSLCITIFKLKKHVDASDDASDDTSDDEPIILKP